MLRPALFVVFLAQGAVYYLVHHATYQSFGHAVGYASVDERYLQSPHGVSYDNDPEKDEEITQVLPDGL